MLSHRRTLAGLPAPPPPPRPVETGVKQRAVELGVGEIPADVPEELSAESATRGRVHTGEVLKPQRRRAKRRGLVGKPAPQQVCIAASTSGTRARTPGGSAAANLAATAVTPAR